LSMVQLGAKEKKHRCINWKETFWRRTR
jgi:hypothetical protein